MTASTNMVRPGLSIMPTAPVSETQPATPLEQFFDILRQNFDKDVCENYFIPLWTVVLQGCTLEKVGIDNDGYCHLIFDAAYIAPPKPGEDETNYIEKEVVMCFVREYHQFIFPHVEALKGKLDPDNKNLHGIWGLETWLGKVFSGVAYSIRWDESQMSMIYDNKHNLPWGSGFLATPRNYHPDKIRERWIDRPREKVVSESTLPKGELGTQYA